MPGAEPLLNTIDTVLLADQPQNVEIWVPSALPSASRDADCTHDLPQLEYQLRYKQATNALHEIRQYRHLIKAVTAKTQSHILNTQKTVTRTRSLFDRIRKKQALAVSTYQILQQAIQKLNPKEKFGSWKKTLLELRDADVSGPGHEEGKRSGPKHVQSWIWKTGTQGSLSADSRGLRTIIGIEWCKTEERAKRYEEEIRLTVEDMRRTLASFEYDVEEWRAFAASPPRW